MLNKLTDKEYNSIQKKFRERHDDYNVFVFLLEKEERNKNKLSIVPCFLKTLFLKIKDLLC